MASSPARGEDGQQDTEAALSEIDSGKPEAPEDRAPGNEAPVRLIDDHPTHRSLRSAQKSVWTFKTPQDGPPTEQMAYSVQVGSFRTKPQADRHVDTVVRNGFNASIVRLRDSGGREWYVVQIGDFAVRSEAAAAARRFEASTGGSSLIKAIPAQLLAERTILPGGRTESDGSPAGAADTDRFPIPDLAPLVREGAYADAAETCRRQMQGYEDRYAIKLEVNCSVTSVKEAFIQGGFDRNIFLLPMALQGKPCFAVMWGVFETRRSAATATLSVPPFFMNQSNRPQPVRLGDYLSPPDPTGLD
jgi:hypothetical protein